MATAVNGEISPHRRRCDPSVVMARLSVHHVPSHITVEDCPKGDMTKRPFIGLGHQAQ
jgi:hypothetical protein